MPKYTELAIELEQLKTKNFVRERERERESKKTNWTPYNYWRVA